MPTFDIDIETSDPARPRVRLSVEAHDWVAAWQASLRSLGEEAIPPDARCALRADGTVDIRDASAGRRFVVRRSPPSSRAAPRPRRDPGLGDRAPSIPRRAHDPGARPLASREVARLQRAAEGAARVNASGRDLEPATLAGLPTGHRARPRDPERRATSPFSRLDGAAKLPHEFRAIARAEVDATADADAVLADAVTTCWDQIDCEVAQVLRVRDADHLEVIATRGARERLLLGCAVRRADSFRQLAAGYPLRLKLPADGPPTQVRYVAGDGAVVDQPVTAALCGPIVVDGALEGVILLLNTSRPGGFADAELQAVSYLATHVGDALMAFDRGR